MNSQLRSRIDRLFGRLHDMKYFDAEVGSQEAFDILNALLYEAHIMKLDKFNLTEAVERQTPQHLVAFMYRAMHDNADNKRQTSSAEADDYMNKVNQALLSGFTNGERFIAVGVYTLKKFKEEGNGRKKKATATVEYALHAYVGKSRLAAVSHLQCGVRKNWGRDYEIEPVIERTMSLLNAMKLGAQIHEDHVQGKLGEGREAGGIEGSPAEGELDSDFVRAGFVAHKDSGL